MSSNGQKFSADARFFTVATAGHVDHGKTSLIRALTGINPDRLKEEQERQMTTDLGFAYLRLRDDLMIGFVDVPGHGKFLKNMLAGVGGVDMALLVVAADEGPMPQTKQHARILSLLGVKKAVVALTKIDMVDDAEQIEIVQEEIAELLKQHGIELLQLVPVSSTKGTGIDQLKSALSDLLANDQGRGVPLPSGDGLGPVFLPVDRVFSKTGFGTVITGTLVRGELRTGDQVVIGPDIGSARVRRLETFGQTVDIARAGQRVACNLVLKEERPLTRGHVVLGREHPSTKTVVAALIDQPSIAGSKLIERVSNQPVRLYHGTSECHGYIRWAEQLPIESNAFGNIVLVFIALEDPVIAEAQDHFVVRMSDETIYGGIVLLLERLRWMKRPQLIKLAQFELAEQYEQAILEFIEGSPYQIVGRNQLSLMLPRAVDDRIVKEMAGSGAIAMLGLSCMSPGTRAELSRQLVTTVGALNAKNPDQSALDLGVAMEIVRTSMETKVDRPTFQSLLEAECQSGKVQRTGDKVRLPGAAEAPRLDDATAKLHEKIAHVLADNLCLEVAELAKLCGIDANKMKTVVQGLAKQNDKVQFINYEFVVSQDNLLKAHHVLSEIFNRSRNISPSEFREKLNTTRKYAMALLQHFDDTKVTRRLESGRVLLKAPPTSN